MCETKQGKCQLCDRYSKVAARNSRSFADEVCCLRPACQAPVATCESLWFTGDLVCGFQANFTCSLLTGLGLLLGSIPNNVRIWWGQQLGSQGLRELLLCHCPAQAFPQLRQVLLDVSRGTFGPLIGHEWYQCSAGRWPLLATCDMPLVYTGSKQLPSCLL
jgi:hypothetical protein